MSKQYETGHSKNVANFQKLIEQIAVYTKYNPPIESLKLENLNILYNSGLTVLKELEEKRNANKIAIHQRQEAYENLKPISSQIISHLDILNPNEGTFEQAKSLKRLIQGSSTKTKKVEENKEDEETKTTSTSRQSYTELAENFSKLLQVLATVENYHPNTEALKLENLTSYHVNLVSTTQAVNQTEAIFKTKLIERNNLLYADNTGLYDIAQDVKKYVKSVYGNSAKEYTNISKIKFTNK
ncbi:conserved hypothetical protein [Tenacibaculum sp. 190524A02b]|uniref:Uncharacterized protein n=1 Tax=Tenacibaculum vairaonense TaxID=3137860 RepID=A0ABP1FBW2_9FLAO